MERAFKMARASLDEFLELSAVDASTHDRASWPRGPARAKNDRRTTEQSKRPRARSRDLAAGGSEPVGDGLFSSLAGEDVRRERVDDDRCQLLG